VPSSGGGGGEGLMEAPSKGTSASGFLPSQLLDFGNLMTEQGWKENIFF